MHFVFCVIINYTVNLNKKKIKVNFVDKKNKTTHLCTFSFHQIGQEKYMVKSNDEDESNNFIDTG